MNINMKTKMVRVDEVYLELYDKLTPKEFKELFIAYFKYKDDEVIKPEDFSTTRLYMFAMVYIPAMNYMSKFK